MSAASKKDTWDKMQALSALFASLLVPLAVAFVGNTYATAMKDAENKLRYVELAISILRADPSKESQALRGWAVEVLSSQSVVPISEDVKLQLRISPLSFKYLKSPMTQEWADFLGRAGLAPGHAASAPSK